MNPFIRPRQVDRPALRFIGFHHAGGSAFVYHPLARRLPADWEILLYDLPGHGGRRGEPLYREMGQVISGAIRDIAPHTDIPYVLFGHSMGAIAASEVGRRLAAALRPPAWVGVSGRIAPSAQRRGGTRLSRLGDAELFASLLRLGGTPARLGEEPELRELFLMLVRADFEAVDSYEPDPRRLPLPCPVTAFGGVTDPWAPPASLAGWERETTSRFNRHLFPGGHFYFLDSAFGSLAWHIQMEVADTFAGAAAGRGEWAV